MIATVKAAAPHPRHRAGVERAVSSVKRARGATPAANRSRTSSSLRCPTSFEPPQLIPGLGRCVPPPEPHAPKSRERSS